jgi:hypothetical protein
MGKDYYDITREVSPENRAGWVDIRIDWWDPKDRHYPKVTVIYGDGSRVHIDIIRSIQQNEASIGHPFIVRAISHLTGVVRYHRALALGREELQDNRGHSPSDFRTLTKKRHDIAKGQLERIGKALIDGAIKRALKIEDAVEAHALMEHIPLHLTWKLLKKEEVKKMPAQKKLEAIKALFNHALEKVEGIKKPLKSNPTAELMVRFLGDYSNKRFLDDPGRDFRVIRNAFDGWYFRCELKIVISYRSRAKRNNSEEKPLMRFLFPETNNEYNVYGFSNPTLVVIFTESNSTDSQTVD